MLHDLVVRNRSYRRFEERFELPGSELVELVDLARLSASAGNFQPLRYLISCEPQKNARIFKHLSWAAYLKDWAGPEAGERPGGYIVIMQQKDIRHPIGIDHGIAAQSILLGAVEKGWGGCLIGAFDRKGLAAELELGEEYELLLVIALGKPKEKVVLEEIGEDGDVKYWRDDEEIHHVPKRTLAEVLVG